MKFDLNNVAYLIFRQIQVCTSPAQLDYFALISNVLNPDWRCIIKQSIDCRKKSLKVNGI